MSDKKKIVTQPLSLIISDCFGRYAKYIIQDRALPDARDGLKPVQRRILYAMYELGLNFDKAYKKSARTVGEVIGKYHPHGDSSIYEAMVRMSQNWKNNLPLLDMHGNNGSIDGDSAAAMRYTECKLSEVSTLMLDNIKKATVTFSFNFDDSEKEPTVLPAMLPNLVINGAMGIAAGYATNIPPHNPTEIFNAIIHLIDTPNAHLDTILKLLPGPDFPTGGIIEGKEGIKDYFETGKGKFLISSKISFNERDKRVNQIIIHEIPYDTNKSTIIKELNDILYDEKISGLIEVRDESDKNGINIVIDVRKDKNLVQIKNFLLKNTSLQINYATNFVAIVDRKPTLLPIKDALNAYIKHALEVQYKTALYDLNKYQERLEIVEGLIKAINQIDEVIRLIRKSDSKDSARQALMDFLSITWNQAEAIVTLRLYRLTRTNIDDLLIEAKELNEKINNLLALINSEELQRMMLKQKMREYRDKYGYKRKTQISEEVIKLDVDASQMIDIKEVAVIVSRDGYLKTVTKKMIDSNEFKDLANKETDFIFFIEKALTNQNLMLVTQEAKTLFIPIYKLKNTKWKDIGEHINNFTTINPRDKIIFAKVVNQISENDGLVLFTKFGITKIIRTEEAFNTKQLKLSSCFKLKPGDQLVSVNAINLTTDYFLSILNNKGLGYSFSTGEIPILSKTAQGVKSIKLKPGEFVINTTVSKALKPCGLIVSNKALKLVSLKDFKILGKNSVGKTVCEVTKDSQLLNFLLVDRNNSEISLLVNDNQVINFKSKNLGLDLVKFTKIKDVNDIFFASINNYLSDSIRETIDSKDELPKPRESFNNECESDDDSENNNLELN